MAAIYRYVVEVIDKDAKAIEPNTGFVAADSCSKAVEKIESYVGSNKMLCSVNMYEAVNPISDASIKTIFEDT